MSTSYDESFVRDFSYTVLLLRCLPVNELFKGRQKKFKIRKEASPMGTIEPQYQAVIFHGSCQSKS